MSNPRTIQKIIRGKHTVEGAGVHLKRVFGFDGVEAFDPFLLFDDFRSNEPEYYLKGFPWHPHRGIETITYMIDGRVEHGDSMGNKGIIGSGDVQWMTAGSGIIHQEMPLGDESGDMGGFQLWANLPASMKMMDPRYREVKSGDIPCVVMDNGATVRIISGTVAGHTGPVRDIVIDPEYIDVTVPPGSEFLHPTKTDHTVLAYVFEGRAAFAQASESSASNGQLVLFGEGDHIAVATATDPVRFLLISGKPIREPVAWYGPIVMNTQEELRIAFEEYNNGTFIKHRAGS
jgi:redox-sensitive bicupin YhaK (pirin superfamily)